MNDRPAKETPTDTFSTVASITLYFFTSTEYSVGFRKATPLKDYIVRGMVVIVGRPVLPSPTSPQPV